MAKKIYYDEGSKEPYVIHGGYKYALRVLDKGNICTQPVSGKFTFWLHISEVPLSVRKAIEEYNRG